MKKNMPIDILDLETHPRYWPAFLDLPNRVYQDDPFYTKTAIGKVRAAVERQEFADRQQTLLALDDGQPIARLVVRAVDNFIDDQQGRIGVLGSFDALDDQRAVHGLFDHARKWLADKGIHHLVGPMDGDTWHKYRFNVGSHDRPPFMMEPYNRDYYPELWQSYGFEVLAEYYSKRVDDVAPLVPFFERFYKRSLRNGFQFRPFQKSQFEDELRILYDLSCESFADNVFYNEITFPEFRALYSGTKSILHENLVWFSLDRAGKYCGFLFTFPDYFHALQSMDGSAGLWAKLKFVMNRRKAEILNIKSLATLPKYHGTGLGPALLYKGYSEALNMGYKTVNLCLIHQDNVSGRLDGDKGYLIRNYQLYHFQD